MAYADVTSSIVYRKAIGIGVPISTPEASKLSLIDKPSSWVIRLRLRQEAGVSLVEFALILPLFMLLLLGMVDLGQGFNRYLVMLNATREGALWLSRNPADLTGMEARIASEIQQSGLPLDNIVVIRTPQKGVYASGDLVKLTLESKYTLMFGAITRIPSLTLHTEHTIRVQ